jgi:hypothetical protein
MHHDQLPCTVDGVTLGQYRDWLAGRFERLAEVERLRELVIQDIDDACDELDDHSLELIFTELESTGA